MVDKPVRVLLFSTLYPSSARPGHGIFVETRLLELLRSGAVQARVLAPVPWFPSTNPRFGDRACMALTPHRESRHGVDVLHPRYPLLPKVGMTLAPLMLALVAWRQARKLISQGQDFDLVDAHYFYPDGVAAALLARWLGKPLVITARGSDVNLIAQHALPRRMIRWAARQATACVGVSRALATRLEELGAPAGKVHVLRNGVDTERFQPLPQAACRQSLGLDGGPWLLSVGNLLPVKRHELVIDALAQVRQVHPKAQLAIVGAGPLAQALRARAAALGLGGHIRLVGAVAQDQLPTWYGAADVLVLASSREGWPNVLLESMACGTPVVASRVGGVEEVVVSPLLGAAVDMQNSNDVAQAVLATLAAGLNRSRIRDHALTMGWPTVSAAQLLLFRQAVASATTAACLAGGGRA